MMEDERTLVTPILWLGVHSPPTCLTLNPPSISMSGSRDKSLFSLDRSLGVTPFGLVYPPYIKTSIHSDKSVHKSLFPLDRSHGMTPFRFYRFWYHWLSIFPVALSFINGWCCTFGTPLLGLWSVTNSVSCHFESWLTDRSVVYCIKKICSLYH